MSVVLDIVVGLTGHGVIGAMLSRGCMNGQDYSKALDTNL